MELHPIDRADLAAAWPIAEPWLVQACARPGCDLAAADLRDACARGEAVLILIQADTGPVAAGVTQVREHRAERRTCWVLAVGGARARDWRHTLRQIEAGAALRGCAAVEFVGRPGWGRLLPDYAAAPCEAGTHYSKSLGA